MFCTSCGAQFDDNQRFCPQCGAQAQASQQPAATPPPPPVAPPPMAQTPPAAAPMQQPAYQQGGYAGQATAAEKMTLMKILFSFQGRITRKMYWVNFVLLFALPFSILIVVIDAAVLGNHKEPVLATFIPLFLLWPSLAAQIKRWHDRDKSGWWMLISLVPIIGPLWVLVEVGFLRGTVGPNRFGPEQS